MKPGDAIGIALLVWLFWPRPQGSSTVIIGDPNQYGNPGETL